jgi:hypothetical protein
MALRSSRAQRCRGPIQRISTTICQGWAMGGTQTHSLLTSTDILIQNFRSFDPNEIEPTFLRHGRRQQRFAATRIAVKEETKHKIDQSAILKTRWIEPTQNVSAMEIV